MIRLAIAVEGRTEGEFVTEVLADHLREMSVEPTRIFLNGNVTVERLASYMERLSWSFDFVTSLVDFYGFRDKGNASIEELEQRILATVVSRINRSFDESRIFPYVQLHEFEGLLFSDVNVFRSFGISEETLNSLIGIRAQFRTPEDINDNVDTAPSKRLEGLLPEYDKVVFGPLVALEIGLDKIRAECPRFNEWLIRLGCVDI